MTTHKARNEVEAISQLHLNTLKSVRVSDGVSYIKVTRKNIMQYCEQYCPNRGEGCAITCSIRKRLQIPPHGDHYWWVGVLIVKSSRSKTATLISVVGLVHQSAKFWCVKRGCVRDTKRNEWMQFMRRILRVPAPCRLQSRRRRKMPFRTWRILGNR